MENTTKVMEKLKEEIATRKEEIRLFEKLVQGLDTTSSLATMNKRLKESGFNARIEQGVEKITINWQYCNLEFKKEDEKKRKEIVEYQKIKLETMKKNLERLQEINEERVKEALAAKEHLIKEIEKFQVEYGTINAHTYQRNYYL